MYTPNGTKNTIKRRQKEISGPLVMIEAALYLKDPPHIKKGREFRHEKAGENQALC
jgi:hypothetical protein